MLFRSFPHRTVESNIATVPLLLGWDKKKARARARELMERVGLEESFAKRYPHQLSGGQQQRVGVARALAADPPVMLMDEPFSAVDPIVRDQLQASFLELQQDIGKTILFVTHDIDEAVKLGDQVAVLRVGGHLAQIAPPATLLADPEDDFVADFVGRDRGYRALSFLNVGDVALTPEPSVRLGEVATTSAPWVLVVDERTHPVGWVEPHRLTAGVHESDLHRGGTLARVDGSLRALLDAALSSPSGRGVVVDAEGLLLGTTTASKVLATIEAARHEVGST